MLDVLLTGEPVLGRGRADGPFAAHWREVVARGASASTADLAVLGGFLAPSVGFAFASGYQAALRRLVPGRLGDDAIVALCATEPDVGAHPARLATRLAARSAGYVLDGHKSFVTLGHDATELLVLAVASEADDGHRELRLVQLSRARDGVTLEALPALPFVADVGHAAVRFEGVDIAPDDILPGDGHTDYSRPFRTVEDAHVTCALMGRLVAVARASSWTHEAVEDLVAATIAIHAVASLPPRLATTHVALAGAMRVCHAHARGHERAWAAVEDAVAGAWQRDLALLEVAAGARRRRRELAWHSLFGL